VDVEDEAGESLALFYSGLKLVWHLCEVLFVEVLAAGCLIQQLLEWVQHNLCTFPTVVLAPSVITDVKCSLQAQNRRSSVSS